MTCGWLVGGELIESEQFYWFVPPESNAPVLPVMVFFLNYFTQTVLLCQCDLNSITLFLLLVAQL
jgi:hypothetical protein